MGRILDLLAFWRKKDSKFRKTSSRRREGNASQHRIVPHNLPNAEDDEETISEDGSGTGADESDFRPQAAIEAKAEMEVLRSDELPDSNPIIQEDKNLGKGKNKRRISEDHSSSLVDTEFGSALSHYSDRRRHLIDVDTIHLNGRHVRSPAKRPRLEDRASEAVLEAMLVPRRSPVPQAVLLRIASHLSSAFSSLLTPHSPSPADVLSAQTSLSTLFTLLRLSRSTKDVLEKEAWQTLVLTTKEAVDTLAGKFEAGAKEGKWVESVVVVIGRRGGTASLGSSVASTSTSLSTSSSSSSLSSANSDLSSLPSLLFSLSSTLRSLHLFLPSALVGKSFKSLSSMASTFALLETVVVSAGVSSTDLCALVAGCRPLKHLTVLPASCTGDALTSALEKDAKTVDPRFSGDSKGVVPPVAKLVTLETGPTPITAHSLLWLLRSSSTTLRSLGITLSAPPASQTQASEVSTRRALVRAFAGVGKGLREVRVGESWGDPISRGIGRWDPRSSVRPGAGVGVGNGELGEGETVLDEVLVSLSSVQHLHLSSPSLYSSSILPILPFTLHTLTLDEPGVGAEELGAVRKGGMALVGLKRVVVRGGGAKGGWVGEGRERLRRMGIEVEVVPR